MTDLLNKVNEKLNKSKSVKGEGKSSSPSISGQTAGGDVLIGNEDAVTSSITAGESLIDVASETKTSAKAESTEESVSRFKEPETWTKETAMAEVKRLREEAKALRVRKQEEVEQVVSKFKSEMDTMKSEYNQAIEAAKELEALKAKEADKKRSIEEKLAHREALLAETQTKIDVLKGQYEREVAEKEAKLAEFQASHEATMKVYQSRISEELANIPEDRRKFAEMIVKAYEDPREGWTALSEAKMQGLFEDKQVIVSHANPGAGASRMTPDRLNDISKGISDKMTSAEKIAAGLKNVQSRRGKLI